METKARYTLVGTFVLAVVLAGFAFVYWLHNTGGLANRTVYQVRFESSVSGLLTGSNVLFNGIRVGEVTGVTLSPDAPKEVLVTIAIDPKTPVRADTDVSVDFQGLTGAPVIMLTGGAMGAAPVAAAPGEPPLLIANTESTQSLSQSARSTLGRLDKVIDDNSSALHDAISGISAFAGVLARNSERIDGILAGLERFAGGAKAKPGIYNLSPRKGGSLCKQASLPQLVVPEPAAPMAFNSDKVIIVGDPPENSPFEKAQFTDNVPSVVQSKVIESLEGSGCFAAVTRPLDNLEPGEQLQTEIRQFAVRMTPTPTADIEVAAKLISAGGKIEGARVFHESVPLKTTDAPGAVAALDASFSEILNAMVPWLGQLPRTAEPEKKAEPSLDDIPDPPEPPAP
jgi:phospholipid/cholesterol/gamma-HCH transport system substrate-binding protein